MIQYECSDIVEVSRFPNISHGGDFVVAEAKEPLVNVGDIS